MANDADRDKPPSLDDFSARLDAARGPEVKDARREESAAMGEGLRVASELLAAVIVGTGIGWGLDRVFDTSPWITIVGLAFGLAAGLRNAMRAMAD